MTPTQGPLNGTTVLELGALVAAPYCGMLLADMGADVIKVEPPEGDMARHFAPFVDDESAFFMSVNRGKRSIQLDLRNDRHQELARSIAAKADVVLHNFRAGVVERLGLSLDDVRTRNPDVIYCSISGFGPEGPMASRPGIDLLFQAESGMIAVTGAADGPGVKVGTNAADVYAATTAAFAITSALAGRAKTGEGSDIHVSLRDSFLALQACWFTSFLATGQQPARLGSGSPFTAPTDVYQAKDGEIVLAVVNEKHWRIFCSVLGLERLLEDERLASNEGRVANAGYLRSKVNGALASETVREWIQRLDEAGIPAGRVLTYEGVCQDPQIERNGMVLDLEHASVGPIRVQGSPIWTDGRKQVTVQPPPPLGSHNEEIAREFDCLHLLKDSGQ